MRRCLLIFLLHMVLSGCKSNDVITNDDISVGLNTIMYDNGDLRYYEFNSNKYVPWTRFYADDNYIYYEDDGLWRCDKNLGNHIKLVENNINIADYFYYKNNMFFASYGNNNQYGNRNIEIRSIDLETMEDKTYFSIYGIVNLYGVTHDNIIFSEGKYEDEYVSICKYDISKDEKTILMSDIHNLNIASCYAGDSRIYIDTYNDGIIVIDYVNNEEVCRVPLNDGQAVCGEYKEKLYLSDGCSVWCLNDDNKLEYVGENNFKEKDIIKDWKSMGTNISDGKIIFWPHCKDEYFYIYEFVIDEGKWNYIDRLKYMG